MALLERLLRRALAAEAGSTVDATDAPPLARRPALPLPATAPELTEPLLPPTGAPVPSQTARGVAPLPADEAGAEEPSRRAGRSEPSSATLDDEDGWGAKAEQTRPAFVPPTVTPRPDGSASPLVAALAQQKPLAALGAACAVAAAALGAWRLSARGKTPAASSAPDSAEPPTNTVAAAQAPGAEVQQPTAGAAQPVKARPAAPTPVIWVRKSATDDPESDELPGGADAATSGVLWQRRARSPAARLEPRVVEASGEGALAASGAAASELRGAAADLGDNAETLRIGALWNEGVDDTRG